VGLLLRQPVEREARVRRADLPRLAWMALFGAGIGPVALAWGLQHTSGTSASLMLTLEAVFTALLARWWYHESLDRRVRLALGLLTLGGMALVLDRAQGGGGQWLGLLAVLLATAAWGMDNTLSRALAERDPGQVVMLKGLLGALATLGLAAGPGRGLAPLRPGPGPAGRGRHRLRPEPALLPAGPARLRAARTGSVFAFAPFVGAVLAWALGAQAGSLWLAAGAALMLAGILLHLAERHDHLHQHEALVHEHAHTHDDGHHDHSHEPMPQGPHSHPHRHAAVQHAHEHVPDEHHRHRH
jgi:drug/metabolite transporter (DMT)-like permease